MMVVRGLRDIEPGLLLSMLKYRVAAPSPFKTVEQSLQPHLAFKPAFALPPQPGTCAFLRMFLSFVISHARTHNLSLPHMHTMEGPRASREAFRRLIASIEDEDDVRQLYPPSLQSDIAGDNGNITTEREALRRLPPVSRPHPQELDLDGFSIYRALDESKFSGQLEQLSTATKGKTVCVFDGCLQAHDRRCDVVGLSLTSIIIDKLDDTSTVSTAGNIYIASQAGMDFVRYHLLEPSEVYKPYFDSFLWIAERVFHFLAAQSFMARRVRLADFTMKFWDFITNYYRGQDRTEIDNWHAMCGNTIDFRKYIIRYGDFLHSQALKVNNPDDLGGLFDHQLWRDLGLQQTQGKQEKAQPKSAFTIVTSDIGNAFLKSFPVWGDSKLDLLKVIEPAHTVQIAWKARCDRLHFPYKTAALQDDHLVTSGAKQQPKTIARLEEACPLLSPTFTAAQLQEEVVILRKNRRYRYAYVHSIVDENRVKVVWLLSAADTICGNPAEGSYYPIGNELFFSDECSCRAIYASDVVASFGVSIFSERALGPAEFFINMMYRPDEEAFVTISLDQISSCLQCRHTSKERNSTTVGEPIKIMSLFSGAGLMDHAIASSGSFETKLAIEIDATALLSHEANTPNECYHVCTSTNDYLADVLSGKRPFQPEAYNFLVAGCPCQGFSRRNASRTSRDGQRNCSMLANTLSYVDIFRPEFVLIENVTDMDYASEGRANACAQAICCLVAMGYQVRKMVLQGSDYDTATDRKRLFIVAASPGLALPQVPPVVINGENSAYTAISGLENVHNDLAVNIRNPDHIPFARLGLTRDRHVSLRSIIKRVPVTKRDETIDQRSLYGAYERGLLTPAQETWFLTLTQEQQGRSSGSLKRLNPEGYFPTITRTYVPIDSRGGAFIHPHQHRVVTCEEFRRAQGIPDDFMLIGSTEDAISQVGNGVVWQVAQALGESIEKAWLASQHLLGGRVEDGGAGVEAGDEPGEGEGRDVGVSAKSAAAKPVDFGTIPQHRGRPAGQAAAAKEDESDDEVVYLGVRQVDKMGQNGDWRPSKKAKLEEA